MSNEIKIKTATDIDDKRILLSPSRFVTDYLGGEPSYIEGTTGMLFFSSEIIAVKWWAAKDWIFLLGDSDAIPEATQKVTTGAFSERFELETSVHVVRGNEQLAMFDANADGDLLVTLAIPGRSEPTIFCGPPALIEFLKEIEAAGITGAH